MARIVLLRSVPGGGKSFTAAKLQQELGEENVVIASADHYFINPEDGMYKFDSAKLGEAHAQCKANAVEGLKAGKNVIIDNTNLRKKHVNEYIRLARAVDPNIEIVVKEPDDYDWKQFRAAMWVNGRKNDAVMKEYAEKFARRNAHGVSADRIYQMMKNWQEITL